MANPTYLNQVEKITELFSSLEERARNILFPSERKGIFVRPDIDGWSKFLKFAYRLTHPYSVERGPGLLELISLPVMLLLAWLTFTVAFGMVYVVTNSPDNSTGNTAASENILFVLCGGIGIFLSVISYYWWFEGLATTRYTWRAKVFVFILFCGLVLLVSSLFKPLGAQKIFTDTLAIYVLLVIPSLTYFYAIGLDGFVEALYVIITIIRSIDSLHTPIQIGNIRILLTDDLSSLSMQENYVGGLAELRPAEIETLQEWSQANRDASVHRIVPTTVVVTILTLIGMSKIASDWVDNGVQYALVAFSRFFTNPFSDAFLPAIGISLILLFVVWFLKTLARLFRNIAVQNLIIEACIVAKNSKQAELESYKEQKITLAETVCWLIRFLKRFK
jgi:hypothetical protein